MRNTQKEFRSICDLKDEFFPNDKECEKSFIDFKEMGLELSQNTLNKIKTEISKL